MSKTKKSSAQKGREKREAKILRLYPKLRGDYVRAMDLYTAIAEKAVKRKTGARGLRSIIEETMTDVMFRVPSDESIVEITVTKEMVDSNLLLIDKNSDSEDSVVSIEDKKEKSA